MKLTAEQWKRLSKRLSYREREVLKLRYGIGHDETYTLEEIGHIFKVTRERVRTILKRAEAELALLAAGGK